MAKTARIFAVMDVNYFDDDRVIEAGDAWQLHFAAILASKKILSDGRLTTRQLERIAPDSVPDVGGAIAILIGVGLFIEEGDRIIVRGWGEWNDSTEDVEAMADGGKYGNHLRWHIKRKSPKADCEWCFPRGDITPDSGGESPPDRPPNPRVDADAETDPDTDASQIVKEPPNPQSFASGEPGAAQKLIRRGSSRANGTSPRQLAQAREQAATHQLALTSAEEFGRDRARHFVELEDFASAIDRAYPKDPLLRMAALKGFEAESNKRPTSEQVAMS